ncbi:MAG: RICIN domain-containing protein, partial [Atopobiaceae bacterium]
REQMREQAREQGYASGGTVAQERTGQIRANQRRSGQGYPAERHAGRTRTDQGRTAQCRVDQAYANRARSNQGRPGQPGSARSQRGGRPSRQQSLPLPVMVGIGFVALAVVLVLVAWGCSSMAAQQAQEQAQQEQAQEQTQEETLPTDLSGVTEGTYYIELSGVQSSELVLSATGAEDADAYTVVQLGTMGYGASKQRLKLTIVDSDSCTLSTEAGLYLDAGDPTASAGLRLYANQANDSDGQKWQIQSASGGYRIVSKSTGRAIEASSTELGAELVTGDVDDSKASQVFRFVQTNPSDSTGSSTGSDGSSTNGGSGSSDSSSDSSSQGSSD